MVEKGVAGSNHYEDELLQKQDRRVNMKKSGQKGFTLIELLIVIAIIGILAAIAIPMYKTQTIKAKMTEVTNGMSNVASAVSAYYQESNLWPDCPTKADVQNSLGVATDALGRLATLAVDSGTGAITATIGAGVDGTVLGSNLVLTPTPQGDSSIIWDWSSTNMPPAYIPKR
jgi:type IV pilus assembly protein PilA